MFRLNRPLSASRLALLAAAGAVALPAAAFAADTTINIASGQVVTGSASSPAVEASPAEGDSVTINNAGIIRGPTPTVLTALAIGGNGAGAVIINNSSQITGRLAFGDATGPITFNNNAGYVFSSTTGWRFSGTTVLGSGNDSLNNGPNGLMGFGTGNVVLDFGAGSDAFDNAGLIRLGSGNFTNPNIIILLGLETFSNSGTLLFGFKLGETLELSDDQGNDLLQAHDVAYVGEEGRFVMGAPLSAATKLDCSVNEIADCADFSGGSTSGTTYIRVQDTTPLLAAGLGVTDVVLIDVNGGVSHAGDFVLDPGSTNYYADEIFGAAVMKGVFAYTLIYDEDTQRHRLIDAPSRELFAFAQLPLAAQDIWRVASDSWFARAADLRNAPDDAGGRIWAQLGGERVDRDAATSFTAHGQTADIDLSYRQNTAALTFGMDMIRVSQGDQGFLAGAMLGLTDSELTSEASPSSAQLSGEAAGLYASYLAGPLSVNGMVSGSHSSLKYDVPAFTLSDLDKVPGESYSVGARLDGGWALPLSGTITIEPLVSVAYVQTTFEDVTPPGAEVEYDSLTSLRAGAGARVSGAANLGGLPLGFALTGRYWNEFDGETAAVVTNAGTPLPLADELTGSFGEVSGSVSLASPGEAVLGFLQVGSRMMSDYQSYSLSAGVRYRW